MKTAHIFRVVNETDYQSDKIFPEVEMKIDSEASLMDMVEAFEAFLKSIGYLLPENSYLDFVQEDCGSKGEF